MNNHKKKSSVFGAVQPQACTSLPITPRAEARMGWVKTGATLALWVLSGWVEDLHGEGKQQPGNHLGP